MKRGSGGSALWVRRPSWRFLGSVFAIAFLLSAGTAWSEGEQRFKVDVTVAAISETEGSIDKRAKRLDEKLRKKFKYNSLKVIEKRRLTLQLNEVGSVKLPGGRMFRVRALDLGERGLLMAVGWEGEMMMDMRAPNHHLLIIGGPAHGDGQLVISLEPEY